MIHLFDVENGVAIPSVHCLLIPEFKAIVDKYKKKSTNILAYLFYTTYIGSENPYFNYEEEQRKEIVKKDLDIDVKEDELIEKARKKMQKMYETPTMRFYLSLKKTMDNLSDFLDQNNKIIGGKEGNLDDIMKIVDKYEKLRQSFKTVSKDLSEENIVNARGETEIAYDQK